MRRRVARFAPLAVSEVAFSKGQGIKIAPVGRRADPAFENELGIDARAAGKIDPEHLAQFALIGCAGGPEVVDAFHRGGVARQHDA